MHLIRASLRWVNYKDRKKLAAALRLIYGAVTEAAARDALDAFEDSAFGREYPGIARRWRESWELVIPFFDFGPDVRKVLYTTNMIESINADLRKVTRNCGHFPSDEALIKVLYLACKEMGRTKARLTAGRGNAVWTHALNQVDIMFPGRLHWPDPMSRTYTGTLTRPAAELALPASTIAAVLRRRWAMPHLGDLDRLSGELIRHRVTEVRYEHHRPGDLLHVE